MRILIAEDDTALAGFVRKGLESEHYAVDVSNDGEQARGLATELDYDLLVLELNLPRLDGVSILRRVRVEKPTLPILVLTARGRVDDRVLCLDAGADDYVIKPFSFSELSARIRALLRRSRLPSESVLRVEDLKLDRVERRVTRGTRMIDLTSKEFALLEYLMRNVGRRVTRAMIIEHVWNLSFDSATNLVDVYVAYLRVVFEAALVSAEHLTYRDYLHRLPEVTYMCSCKLVPMDVTALMQLDLSIAFPLIDLLLGGEGKGTLEPREVTEIEEQILESVVQIICREMGVAWQALGLEFHFDRRQQPANALRLMPPDDKTLAPELQHQYAGNSRNAADCRSCHGIDRIAAKDVGGLGVSQTARSGRIERAGEDAHPVLSLPDRVGCARNPDTSGGIGKHQGWQPIGASACGKFSRHTAGG
jgi:DNA-binding response OmpR family regulator